MKNSVQNSIRNIRVSNYIIRIDQRSRDFLEIRKSSTKERTKSRKYYIHERHIYNR